MYPGKTHIQSFHVKGDNSALKKVEILTPSDQTRLRILSKAYIQGIQINLWGSPRGWSGLELTDTLFDIHCYDLPLYVTSP